MSDEMKKKIKRVTVVGIFKSLSASHYTFTAHGEGSNVQIAAGRAIDRMFKDKHLKGKRNIRHFTLDVTIDESDTVE